MTPDYCAKSSPVLRGGGEIVPILRILSNPVILVKYLCHGLAHKVHTVHQRRDLTSTRNVFHVLKKYNGICEELSMFRVV